MPSNSLIYLLLTFFISTSCADKSSEKTGAPEDNMDVENVLIATLEYEITSLLGEGAFWNHQTQELFWVDIEGKKFHMYDPGTGTNRSFPTPSRIGTVVPYNQDQAIIALEDGIYSIHPRFGTIAEFAEIEKGIAINRFNDGKCDPNGNLWVGSMNLKEDQASGAVYKIAESGEVTMMIQGVTISNGIVWTKDASTMYYIDTPTGKIRAYDFDPATSTISNARTAVVVSPELGYPDGMAIDAEDKLWVGLWNGNAVARFDPLTGKLISKIEVPAHNVTSCAFGGPELDRLYITTARMDMTKAEMEKYPLAGSIFVANPGVKGVPSKFFGKNE